MTQILNRALPYFAMGSAFDEPMSVEGAFSKANLRFELNLRPMSYQTNSLFQSWRQLDNRYQAVVRTDDNACLGVVGKKYEIVQNQQVEELLEHAGWKAWAAGAFDGGSKCYAVLSGGAYSDFQINGDQYFAHIIARWNHDGSGTVKIGPQIWRLTCTNGQKRIEAQKFVTVRHTRSADQNMILAREMIPQMGEAIESFVAQGRQLQSKHLFQSDAQDILNKVFPKPKQTASVAGYNRAVSRWQADRGKLLTYLGHPSLERWDDSAYALVQAVNEFEQWATKTKNLSRSQILRLDADRFPKTEKVLQLVGAA